MPSEFVCHPLPIRKHDQNAATPRSVASSSEEAPLTPAVRPPPPLHSPPPDDVNRLCVGPALHGNEEDEGKAEEEEEEEEEQEENHNCNRHQSWLNSHLTVDRVTPVNAPY